MAAVTELDLNACELIQALKEIEVEGVRIVENDFLKMENANLRSELMEQHKIKMLKHKRMDDKRLKIFEKMVSIFNEEKERSVTHKMILSVSHRLNGVMDMVFQLSHDIMSGGQNDLILNKINQIHKMIGKGKYDLESYKGYDMTDQCVRENMDIESQLDEIQQFDFDTTWYK